jgi:tetratricopeptide (TPR) repeat protein
LQERGIEVATAQLLDFYQEIPERTSGESAQAWQRRYQHGLNLFQQKVQARYSEGTLQRLLDATHSQTRQGAVLALGLCGSMVSNRSLAGMLHDEDPAVRQMASEAMWGIWFRAGTPEQNQELQRLVGLAASQETEPSTILGGFEALLQQAPDFAEVYNQRAICYFQGSDFIRSIKDCERALKLNPHHFGAAGGMAQCYLKQRKLRAALRAYRRSFRINPNLDGVRQAIQSLEKTLGEEGKR